MSVLEEFNGTMTEYEYQKQQERKCKRKANVVKVLVELCDEIDNESADGFLEDCHGYIIGSMLTTEHIIEIINRKIKEVGGEKE